MILLSIKIEVGSINAELYSKFIISTLYLNKQIKKCKLLRV
jgi:hypothetical protein